MSGNHSDFFVFWMKVLPIHVINNGSAISQLQGKHKMVKPNKGHCAAAIAGRRK